MRLVAVMIGPVEAMIVTMPGVITHRTKMMMMMMMPMMAMMMPIGVLMRKMTTLLLTMPTLIYDFDTMTPKTRAIWTRNPGGRCTASPMDGQRLH